MARSTFYQHFESKQDLLFDGFDQGLVSLVPPSPSADRDSAPARFGFSLPLLRHFHEQKRFALAMFSGTDGHPVRRKAHGLLTEMVGRELVRIGATTGEDAMELEARSIAVVGAFTAITAWWLEDHSALPAEEIDRLFRATVDLGAQTKT